MTLHDSGRIVWSGEGRKKETVAKFFAALGPERAGLLTHVSADGAGWIGDVVAVHAPQAVRCLDAFHAVGWITDVLDEVRRAVWNSLRGGKGGATEESKAFQGARWALRKNPDRLSDTQSHPRLDPDHQPASVPGVSAQGTVPGTHQDQG